MYIDTHAHYDDPAFDADREAVFAALRAAQVEAVIDPGCTVASSAAAQQLARQHDFVFFAAGIHPEELEGYTEDSILRIAEMAADRKCVAIGEIGLDYYWSADRKDLQKEVFRRQLELSLELDRPVIVHDREAHGDSLELVRAYDGLRGVFHCFSGSREMAEELLRRGWYLGFDGPITYKNARKALEVLEITPPDRILIETDSPYLPPVPHRGERNSSLNLPFIVDKIAEIKGETHEAIAAVTAENARRLFGLER